MRGISELMSIAPVIPVVALEDASAAGELAQALLEGGIGIIEITLRTPAALAAIERVRSEAPGMCVGAGTVWTVGDMRDVIAAGAQFAVSPGAPGEVVSEAIETGFPYLPGTQTATEIAAVRARGLHAVKFFPAESAGGVGMLKSLSAVFPGLQVCPTGGIDLAKASRYLALDCVPCVGGSWLTPAAMLRERNWAGISALAREASELT